MSSCSVEEWKSHSTTQSRKNFFTILITNKDENEECQNISFNFVW